MADIYQFWIDRKGSDQRLRLSAGTLNCVGVDSISASRLENLAWEKLYPRIATAG
jgi:hypothetical protein